MTTHDRGPSPLYAVSSPAAGLARRGLLRRLPLALAMGLAALMTASAARAEASGSPGEVKLPLAQYETLLRHAQRGDGPKAAWSAGQVNVELPGAHGHYVDVNVSARVTLVGEGPAEIPLLPADAILSEITVDGSAAALVRRDGFQLIAHTGSRRQLDVEVRYRAPVQVSAAGGAYSVIPLPPLPSASYAVDGSSTGQEVDVWPGTGEPGETVSGELPATLAMVVRWGAGLRGYTLRRAGYTVAPDASGDGVDITLSLDVLVTAARAAVPVVSTDVALLDATEGAKPLTTRVSDDWQEVLLTGKGRHAIEVRFRQAIDRTQGQPQVTLALAGAPMTRVRATVPGKRAIQFEPPVPAVTTHEGAGAASAEDADAGHTTAVADLPPIDELTLRWTEALSKPEDATKINAETYQLVHVDEGVLRSTVHIRYDIIRGKTKQLAVALPEGAVLYKVSGDQVEKWPVYPATDDAPRQARIMLSQEREGAYELTLELQVALTAKRGEDTGPLSLPIVKPLDPEFQTGVVALFDGDKVGFGPADAPAPYIKGGENDLPVDIRQALTDKPGQVFRHTGAPGPVRAPIVEAKAREVRFDARVHTLYVLKEGVLVGNASLLVEIKSGRRDLLRVTLPKAVKPLTWNAPSLAKHPEAVTPAAGDGAPAHGDADLTTYEIKFTQALEGAIQIDLEFEELLDKKLSELRLPAVGVVGADVEEGAFGIVADSGIEVTPGEAVDLRRVDNHELPKAVRLRSDREILLGYRYARAPWSLTLGIKRHEVVETLKALATHAWLETIVFTDGHMKTAATYDILNDRQQYLRLTMPAHYTLLQVFAGGAPLKANRDGDALTIPLPKGQETTVTVVFEVARDAGDDGQAEPLGAFGSVELIAPRADLRTSDVQWLVRTPRELALFGTDTELRELSPDFYRPPSDLADEVSVLIRLPDEAEYRAELFTAEELRPEQPPARVALSYAATSGNWAGALVGLLGLFLLALVIRRRAAGRTLGLGGWLMAALGLAAVALKSMAWGLDGTESAIGLLVLVGVAYATRRASARSRGRLLGGDEPHDLPGDTP